MDPECDLDLTISEWHSPSFAAFAVSNFTASAIFTGCIAIPPKSIFTEAITTANVTNAAAQLAIAEPASISSTIPCRIFLSDAAAYLAATFANATVTHPMAAQLTGKPRRRVCRRRRARMLHPHRRPSVLRGAISQRPPQRIDPYVHKYTKGGNMDSTRSGRDSRRYRCGCLFKCRRINRR